MRIEKKRFLPCDPVPNDIISTLKQEKEKEQKRKKEKPVASQCDSRYFLPNLMI